MAGSAAAVGALIVAAGILAGCSDGPRSGAATSTTTTAAATTTTVTESPQAPKELAGFDTTTISIGDRDLLVAVADDPEERSRGLMGVTDLLALDGMLFVFPDDTAGGFWMKDTPLPLDIAFFDARGRRVDVLSMEPCLADPCPTYQPGGSYRYAVEVPSGEVDWTAEGELLGFHE